MITTKELQNTLATRINEAEAELAALKAVTINVEHKTLTKKAVTNGRIGDYLSLGKALYVDYQVNHRYLHMDINAYTYENPDGTQIGTDGFLRISRTMTPLELKESLDKAIASREVSLAALKLDLVNAKRITAKYNRLSEQMDELRNGLSWAARGVLK